MDVLRTPDECFDDLPGYDFAPHYTEIPTGDGAGTLRVHHVTRDRPERTRRSCSCTVSRRGASCTGT